jgi:hypothetical protein
MIPYFLFCLVLGSIVWWLLGVGLYHAAFG